ncbi:MAG: hypothetical protein KF729_27585 [Sandaracinaceae bacterium]|nr:hypothetical protein [Sandaracinaceae bacterium]
MERVFMKPIEAPAARLVLRAFAPIPTREIVLDVIDTLIDAEITASRYGIADGAVRLRFSRDSVERDVDKVFSEGTFLATGPNDLEIRIRTSFRAGLIVDSAVPLSPSDVDKQRWLRAADRLRETLAPEYLVIGWAPILRERPQRWADERDLAERLMVYGMDPVTKDYYLVGPTGLSLRTYLCAHYVDLIGRETLSSLPACVTYLDDGAVRIDLCEDLLHATFAELVDRWHACMNVLYPREVFCAPEIVERMGGIWFRNPAPRFVPPPREKR